MITFAVPLKAKAVSRDWEQVTRIFNRTLASIYNQTDPNFKIVVACHDIHELTKTYDGRVEFLISDSPVPKDREEMMLDKGWKISMAALRIRELGAGYVMLVDSDDLVSNRIAEYVNANPRKNGFLSSYGYVYNEGSPYVKKMYAMHRTCGSCSIVNYSVEDLPDRMPVNIWDRSHTDQYIIRQSHRGVPDYLKEHGRELEKMPFPTTIYVRNTGDNHSMLGGSDMSWKRKVELMLRPRIAIDEALRTEFGI